MLPFILSIAIFLVIGGVVSTIILMQTAEKKKRVMSVIQGAAAIEIDKKGKVNAQDQRRFDLAKKLKDEDKSDKKSSDLNDKIVQAGLEITAKKFWVYSVVCCVVFTALAKLFGFSLLIVLLTAVTSLLGLPRMFLKMKINRRQKLFMDDFADVLESMMRMLKAGMPVAEAIKMVAQEFSGPVGEEMERIYDQQKIGVPLPEAVLEASKRMPLTEMQMFATAIAIQTQTGSSLSEVLQNLANVIRSRFQLKRKVKALSSEAKSSAMIIGALPVVVGLGMYFINREYIEVLFFDPTGQFLLGCAVTWMGIGVLIMRQMINFKV
ncbi:MAG: type II secretion system F family protein [Alphaproteobacteria bacterium]|nr:type II secretion system F family protein [Alphaproteobacteria bacterium]